MGEDYEISSTKHRLKQDELVRNVMYILSEELDRIDGKVVSKPTISFSSLRSRLAERYGIDYHSDRWLYTQLRRYEHEIGCRLFDKYQNAESGESELTLYEKMESFVQKQHLHVAQKIKVANGVFDHISVNAGYRARGLPLRIYLGAGTTVYHLSLLFAQKLQGSMLPLEIHTHNAGCLDLLSTASSSYDGVSVSVLGGRLDPHTMTLLGFAPELLQAEAFDYVIQGTTRVCNGKLYIESEAERLTKQHILRTAGGTKILVLTKYEFSETPLPGIEPYGGLSDYDLLVIPRSFPKSLEKEHDLAFVQYSEQLQLEIRNWNYEIFTILH